MPVSDHRPAPVSQQSLPHLSALSHYERRFRDPRSGGYTASFAERSFRQPACGHAPAPVSSCHWVWLPRLSLSCWRRRACWLRNPVRAVSQFHSLTALRSWLRRPVCIAVLPLFPELVNPRLTNPEARPRMTHARPTRVTRLHPLSCHRFQRRVTPRLTNPEARPRMTHDRPTRVTRLHPFFCSVFRGR